ncbi:NAD-dependent epimerase/dehydratase family protein [Salinibacterium hongtaonis]|uniref:NAD-dependent epimerase/dehydratase family protein n=1 Tax=Homoserinimonas hongtaonis TaxID=2079791 RepID=UPI001304F8F6|nr:NAD(P)-dependent oxidoreductase [Salinibacterium hongtaonis]
MTPRTVAVTGGNGFIGAWVLKNILDRGHRPVVLDLTPPGPFVLELLGTQAEELEWVTGDIRDGDEVSAVIGRADAVVHLAGVLTPFCRANPIEGVKINVIGSTNVFGAAVAAGIQGVSYASSAAVYSGEGLDLAPTSLYGATKLSAELLATAFAHEFGLDSMGLRPFVVYGPGREAGASAGVSLACRAAAHGEEYEIAFGGMTDAVHVVDVADAFVVSALKPLAGAHSCSVSGALVSVGEIASTIGDLVPGARISVGGEDLGIHPDISEFDLRTRRTDFVHTDLRDGLAHTINAYSA